MPDDRAIRDVIDSWYRAMELGDVSGLLTLVTPDVIVKVPELEPIVGRQALGQALSAFFDTHSETVEFTVEEIEISGPLAFSRVREAATISSRSGAETDLVNGMHFTVLRRQQDGEWLIARDISSRVKS